MTAPWRDLIDDCPVHGCNVGDEMEEESMGRELTKDEMAEIKAMGERLCELAREVDANVVQVNGMVYTHSSARPHVNIHTNWHPEHIEDKPSRGWRGWAAWDGDDDGRFRYLHAVDRR